MGLSCLNDLLGRNRGDGRGCRVGSGVVARGGGEAARRDIGVGVCHYDLERGEVIRRKRMIRDSPNNLRQTLFFFRRFGREAPSRGQNLKIRREHRHKRGSKSGKGAVANSVSLLSPILFFHALIPIALHSGLAPSRLLPNESPRCLFPRPGRVLSASFLCRSSPRAEQCSRNGLLPRLGVLLSPPREDRVWSI